MIANLRSDNSVPDDVSSADLIVQPFFDDTTGTCTHDPGRSLC